MKRILLYCFIFGLCFLFHTKASAIVVKPQVAAGPENTVGLKSDGTVVAVGMNWEGELNVGAWTDIVQVAAANCYTVGLKSDGTVVAVGLIYTGLPNFSNWTDIVQVAAGFFYTVGLKSDGTVVAVGPDWKGQLDVSAWTDIVQVDADDVVAVALKSDGTVVAVGLNSEGIPDVSSWTDIVQIAAGGSDTGGGSFVVGLKSDGTVVAAEGWGGDWYGRTYNLGSWTDIVQVDAGNMHTLGLKSNGTVVAEGADAYGQTYVSAWNDIVQVAGGRVHTVGLKSDGTVVAVGENSWGQIDVSGWKLLSSQLDAEAEDCELYGGFQSVSDPAASGGSFVHAPNGVGTRDLPDEAQKMVCRFSVPSGGIYHIKGVVKAPSPAYANNSFFVKVDGAPGAGYLWDTPESARWTTDAVSDRNGSDPVGVTLAAGVHTVTVYLREDGASLTKSNWNRSALCLITS